MKKCTTTTDKFQWKYGAHVSVLIAIITSVPRLIRFKDVDFLNTFHLFCYTVVIIWLLWLICQFFITHKSIKNGVLKCLCAIAVCIAFSTLFQPLWNALCGNPNVEEQRMFRASMHLNFYQQIWFFLFKGVMFSGLVYFIAYSLHTRIRDQKNQLEIQQLKQENLEARLKLLKQQVSPHFLFNALSTLKTTVSNPRTKNYIVQLSNIYRYLLNDKDGRQVKNLVSLADELAFIQSYLYILVERFEDALQVKIEVDEQLLPKKLPPLALQILIENAIKHNIVSPDEPLLIEVYSEGDDLLTVRNRLQPKLSTDDSLGIGLQNVRDRYQLLGDKEIEVIPTDDTFTVKIPLL